MIESNLDDITDTDFQYLPNDTERNVDMAIKSVIVNFIFIIRNLFLVNVIYTLILLKILIGIRVYYAISVYVTSASHPVKISWLIKDV